jgi:LmbE family N-acetylglucosaminyl deacetylase
MDLSANPTAICRNPEFGALVLAPHPDDFDCIVATMGLLRDAGISIEIAVLTGAASGVDDEFCSPCTNTRKAEIRRAEQRESCALFGLPDDRLRFLDLEEDEDGHPIEHLENTEKIRASWLVASPSVVFMPHYNDTNAAHRRAYDRLRQDADR